MRKNSWFCILLLCLCLILGGCSLAIPESEEQAAQEDRFVGVWVALSHLDTTFEEGDEFPVGTFQEEEEQSILYLYSGVEEDENGSCTMMDAANGVMEVKSHVHVSDEGETSTMEGTIYATKNSSGLFVPYALYQRAEGSCYVGECLNGMQSNFYAGSSMSIDQERSRTVTDSEGRMRTESSKFTLNMVFIDQLQSAQAVFLDENYTVLSKQPLGKENITLEFPGEAELLFIEETYLDIDGEPYTTRTVYQRGTSETEYHNLKWEGEKGIVSPTTITISGLLR